MEHACGYLKGLLLPAGQSLSLKDAYPSPVYQRAYCDVLGLGISPRPVGMSQVAGTLHKAALLAGLTIVERKHYKLPAVYLPHGQEAMFDTETKANLVIRNDKREPVWIQAALLDKRSKLEIRIYGSPWVLERPMDLKSSIVETYEPPKGVVYLELPTMRSGETRRVSAIPGFRVRVERIWCNLETNATRSEFLYEDTYEPQQETVYFCKGEAPKQ